MNALIKEIWVRENLPIGKWETCASDSGSPGKKRSDWDFDHWEKKVKGRLPNFRAMFQRRGTA